MSQAVINNNLVLGLNIGRDFCESSKMYAFAVLPINFLSLSMIENQIVNLLILECSLL